MTCGAFLYNNEKNAKEKNVENNNEPFSLLLFFATKTRQPRMTTSQDLGSLSSFAPKEKNQQTLFFTI
jgi:hypothetical protein